MVRRDVPEPGPKAAGAATDRFWDPKDLIRRLRRIEGQARGVQALVSRGAACREVETQIAAMQGALGGVMRVVAACRLAEAIECGAGPLDAEAVRTALRREATR